MSDKTQMVTVTKLEEQIQQVEGFQVILRLPSNLRVPEYTWKRAYKQDSTLTDWKKSRFAAWLKLANALSPGSAGFAGRSVDDLLYVVDGVCEKAVGNIKLANLNARRLQAFSDLQASIKAKCATKRQVNAALVHQRIMEQSQQTAS